MYVCVLKLMADGCKRGWSFNKGILHGENWDMRKNDGGEGVWL